MEDLDRPPLGAEVYENIEDLQYSVQKIYATRLDLLFVKELWDASSIAGRLSGGEGLRPPKRPAAIGKCLGAYAIALFDIESSFYPLDDGLSVWLEKLARRVEEEILAHVLSIGNSPMRAAVLIRLTYHASEQQMREAIRAALQERIDNPSTVAVSPATMHPLAKPTTIQHHVSEAQPQRALPRPGEPAPEGPAESPKSIIDGFCVQKGWSLDQLADKAGIDRKQVFKVRSGRTVRRYALAALGDLLGVAPERLLPRKPKP